MVAERRTFFCFILLVCCMALPPVTCRLQSYQSCMKQRHLLPDECCLAKRLAVKFSKRLSISVLARTTTWSVLFLLTGSFSCEGAEHTAGGQSLPSERWQASCWDPRQGCLQNSIHPEATNIMLCSFGRLCAQSKVPRAKHVLNVTHKLCSPKHALRHMAYDAIGMAW